MAEHISEILAMGGVKKRNVEIKPTCSPSPCVHLTGPRCEVEDLKDSLKAFIQSLKTKECEVKGPGAQQFFQGLRRVFQLCEQNSFGSVALPVIGPGIVLSIPVKDAVNILTHEICKFLSGPTGQLHTICIPIMPNYPNSEEMFQTVRGNLSAEMVDSTGQALFQSLTSDLDEIIMIVDRTEVHLVFGDITNETTDAIVNTTDFKDFQTAGIHTDF
ncbi:poly [ADP-ribose] polymerase 14-like protein [Labeo rohita]|uniref:Poly [ADP-ribose] polymerase 14-like protein n=1 Tax=Labeo rohita TaxID=84645 RepID=A0A498M5I7_LABRO|nr:poly [ADP-ribose] polymerase 14-like protein [Labeo rohita]